MNRIWTLYGTYTQLLLQVLCKSALHILPIVITPVSRCVCVCPLRKRMLLGSKNSEKLTYMDSNISSRMHKSSFSMARERAKHIYFVIR